MREKFFEEEDIDKTRKSNRFHREEEMNDLLHTVYCLAIRCTPVILVVLFVIDIIRPPWIANIDLVDRVVCGLGGGLLGSLLTKVNQQDP